MDPYVQVACTMALIALVFLILIMIGRAFQDRNKND